MKFFVPSSLRGRIEVLMPSMKIAILGSTGNIAKGLIENLLGHDLVLFSRSKHRPLGMFPFGTYDVVINCIGVGEKLWTDPFLIFRTTETFDNMVLDYIHKNSQTLYINFSSGAVFGNVYDLPADRFTVASVDLDGLARSASSLYGIAKMNSEAKHRALPHLNIADLRVFSYFSRHADPVCRTIMSEILHAVRNKKTLVTSPEDFMRDYVHPKDLAQLVEKCLDLHDVNAAFDVYSLRPVGKFELLDHFVEHYGLSYYIDPDFPETSPTGAKPKYYSTNTAAEDIGYHPQHTSLEAIAEEAAVLLPSFEPSCLRGGSGL